KNNPVLIGEPGVGKTAIVEGLALRIFQGDVPESLKNRRVVALDMGALDAGNVVLFIDELHTVVGAGAAEGGNDAANLLKPALARGELRCIGATTLDEYRKYIEKDPALERRFQPVLVGEPSVEDHRHPPRPQTSLRSTPQRRADQRLRARRRGRVGQPL